MEFLLMIVVLVAATWCAALYRHGGLLGGCLFVLLVGSCFGHFFYNVKVGPLPLTADRVLLVLLAIAFLFAKWRGSVRMIRFDQADVLVAVFLLVLVVSTFTHDWRSDELKTLAKLAFFFVMPIGMYWIARESPITERMGKLVFLAFALFGLYLAITAILEKFGPATLVFPRYIASPTFPEFLGRARGPLMNPSANGLFLAAGLAGGLMLWPWLSRTGRLVLLAFAPLYAAGVYCTMTRCVWLGAFATVTVCLGCSTPKRWRPALFGAIFSCVLIGVGAKWNQLRAFKRDKHVSIEDMQKSASLRPVLAQLAWRMFLDRPLHGCGFGRYEDRCKEYLSERGYDLSMERARGYEQHNVLLELLTETGLLGAGSYGLLLLFWSLHAWRLWRDRDAELAQRQQGLFFLSWFSAYLIIGMLQAISIAPMVNMLVFFLAGLTRNLAADSAAASLPLRAGTAPLARPVA